MSLALDEEPRVVSEFRLFTAPQIVEQCNKILECPPEKTPGEAPALHLHGIATVASARDQHLVSLCAPVSLEEKRNCDSKPPESSREYLPATFSRHVLAATMGVLGSCLQTFLLSPTDKFALQSARACSDRHLSGWPDVTFGSRGVGPAGLFGLLQQSAAWFAHIAKYPTLHCDLRCCTLELMEQCCCLADVHLQLLFYLQDWQTQLELTERKLSEVVKEGLRKDYEITELREKHSAIKEKLGSARCAALVGILDKFIHGLDPSSCEDLAGTLDLLADSSTEHTLPAYANKLYLQAKSLMESSIQWQG
jgi:hypothetical protein